MRSIEDITKNMILGNSVVEIASPFLRQWLAMTLVPIFFNDKDRIVEVPDA
jgi:hypothetical protein